MNFTVTYSLLFTSSVILGSIYAMFLVFYINNKAQQINDNNKKRLSKSKEEKVDEINDHFKKKRSILLKQSQKIMLYLLVLDLIINLIIILVEGYYTFLGVAGGLLLPVVCYFIFVFFLWIAIGLKGQKVLFTGKFFKRSDY
jgi:uncharacterized ion transporter superfamily protein YfcC